MSAKLMEVVVESQNWFRLARPDRIRSISDCRTNETGRVGYWGLCRLMSDYKVEMANDCMSELHVEFHGPKDSQSRSLPFFVCLLFRLYSLFVPLLTNATERITCTAPPWHCYSWLDFYKQEHSGKSFLWSNYGRTDFVSSD